MIKLYDILKEAKVVPVGMKIYKYKIGDNVQEMYGNENLAKVIGIRSNFDDVIENPIDINFMPIGVEYDGELYNSPWYLLKRIGTNSKVWQPESEIQLPVEDIDEVKIVPAKKYYAIFNRLGDYNNGVPFYIITDTKEEMVNKLNKIYLELTGEKQAPYSIEDMEDKIYMGKKLDHFISDDWADITDNEQVFKNDISYLKTTPTKIK